MQQVEFDTEYGRVGVAFRTDDGFGQQDVSRVQGVIDAGLSLHESLVVIRPLADALLAQVSGLGQTAGRTLDTVSAEIGLEMGGKGRFIVAEAEAKASLKVTLTWKPGS